MKKVTILLTLSIFLFCQVTIAMAAKIVMKDDSLFAKAEILTFDKEQLVIKMHGVTMPLPLKNISMVLLDEGADPSTVGPGVTFKNGDVLMSTTIESYKDGIFTLKTPYGVYVVQQIEGIVGINLGAKEGPRGERKVKASKGAGYVWQGGALKVTLKSIHKSKDNKKINVVFKAVNITKEDIYLAVYSRVKTSLLDEKGEEWRLKDRVGIDISSRNPTTVLPPGTINTIGMVFEPTGESDGMVFDVISSYIGKIKGKVKTFTVGFSGIPITRR